MSDDRDDTDPGFVPEFEPPDEADDRNPETRREAMRKTIAQVSSHGFTLSEANKTELVRAAGVALAHINWGVEQALRVTRAMSPSLLGDEKKLGTEAAMYLAECLANMAGRYDVPLDLILKATAFYHKSENQSSLPDQDEQAEFEEILLGGAN